jgi:hypothetical protein
MKAKTRGSINLLYVLLTLIAVYPKEPWVQKSQAENSI